MIDMMRDGKPWLIAAAALSAIGSALHFGCIVGGPEWYLFFGAGRRMAHMAELGSPIPALFAAGIGIIVAGWALYALSGAGIIRRLPLLRAGLVAISVVCIARAAALPLALRYLEGVRWSATFLVWSSAVMLVFGLFFAIGTALSWHRL